jgi:hypothetical protein
LRAGGLRCASPVLLFRAAKSFGSKKLIRNGRSFLPSRACPITSLIEYRTLDLGFPRQQHHGTRGRDLNLIRHEGRVEFAGTALSKLSLSCILMFAPSPFSQALLYSGALDKPVISQKRCNDIGGIYSAGNGFLRVSGGVL